MTGQTAGWCSARCELKVVSAEMVSGKPRSGNDLRARGGI